MKGVNNKYVELLMATFEKYRNVESLVRTPSPSAEPGSPLKEKEQVQDIEDVFQAQNSCKYKVANCCNYPSFHFTCLFSRQICFVAFSHFSMDN